MGTGLHPEPVAADGVDLAVVGEEAEGLGHCPGGEGVGRIALVEQDDGALVACISQVEVEERQVARQTKGFVDQGPRRARDDEEILPARCLSGAFAGLAGQEKLALEDVFIHPLGSRMSNCSILGMESDRLVAERRQGPQGLFATRWASSPRRRTASSRA